MTERVTLLLLSLLVLPLQLAPPDILQDVFLISPSLSSPCCAVMATRGSRTVSWWLPI